MSQQMLRISRPTKIELIRLRRRVKVAKRLHKVLKDRLIILTQELISLIKDSLSLRALIHKEVVECGKLLLDGLSVATPQTIGVYSSVRYSRVTAVLGSRVVAGVRVPLIEVEREEGPLDPSTFPLTLLDAGRCYDKLTEDVLRLAEMEISIVKLGREVARVKRRVNALENILIPRMENTIRFLEMKFEEREREDKTRLKKVKEILARRGRVA